MGIAEAIRSDNHLSRTEVKAMHIIGIGYHEKWPRTRILEKLEALADDCLQSGDASGFNEVMAVIDYLLEI